MTKRRTSRPGSKISPQAFKTLSSERQEILKAQLEGSMTKTSEMKDGSLSVQSNGIGRSEWVQFSGESRKNEDLSVKGVIAHGPEYLHKTATIGTTGAGTSAGSSVERLAPEVYSPLFTMANLNLPRDRTTINAWCRNYFLLHPIVRNLITLHATYPISKFNIKCEDVNILKFFEDFIEDIDLEGALGDIALEYWKLGESFPFGEWDAKKSVWSRIIVQNPDYIMVKKSVLSSEPVISLRPDEVLKRLVSSSSPSDLQTTKQIPENILHYIKTGQDIPLDNFNISHLKMVGSAYDIRGTSVIVSAFKDLMLYDKLRESKFAQADGMVNPITLIKVGGNADGEYRATQEDLEYFKIMFEEAQYDKDFKLITHAGVDVQRVGFSGQVLEINSDLELIIKNIYTALMVPPAIIDTAESGSYSQSSIGLEVLRQRYYNFRNMLSRWVQNKIFAPISEAHNFYKFEGGKKKLIIPEVEWNKLNLYDMQDYIGNLVGLLGSDQLSLQTVYKSLGVNYEEEKKKQKKEMIDRAIKEREYAALSKLSLNELRTIDPEKAIPDVGDQDQELLAPSGEDMGAEIDMGGGAELAAMPDMGLGGGPSSGGGDGTLF